MRQDQAGIVFGDGGEKLRIEGEAGGIVDDLGAVVNGQLRHLGFVGVDR